MTRTSDGPAVPARSTDHAVVLVDGRFMHAECACGWRTPARRDRRRAREEAREHAETTGAELREA